MSHGTADSDDSAGTESDDIYRPRQAPAHAFPEAGDQHADEHADEYIVPPAGYPHDEVSQYPAPEFPAVADGSGSAGDDAAASYPMRGYEQTGYPTTNYPDAGYPAEAAPDPAADAAPEPVASYDPPQYEPGPPRQPHPSPGPQSFQGPQNVQGPQNFQGPQTPQGPPSFQGPPASGPYGPPTGPVPPGQPPYGQPQLQYREQQPAPIPRPEDLLVPDRSPVTDQPASWGWRGTMNRMSGGLLKAKAAPLEIEARQAITDIQHQFSRPMTVVVVQPKGGAGKTPTTICLAAALGAHRGGYVVGWDDNETRGTLAVRVNNPGSQRATVWDLLSDLAAFERFDARVGDLSHYVRPQPDAHFDALVSDDNPGNMAQIGEREYQRLHTVLQRFYRMIVVDTGNNVRSPNWQAAVNSADMIVVVSTYQRDVGYSGSWVLDHLAQTGREDLARKAVTVLSAADPTTDKTVRDQLIPHFSARTRAVCEIPYDKELAHGGPIRWAALDPATRNAWIRAGATIVNCLAEDDRRAVAARQG